MMRADNKARQIDSVSGWWNSDNIIKWDKQYDDYDIHTMRYLNSRQEKILEIIDKLGIEKGAKILELDYGAGQTALKLGKRGFQVHGVDVSEKLCRIAKLRCQKYCPEGKFYLNTGNIESGLKYKDADFDLVIAAGVLQYLYDDEGCLKEVFRVLKPEGRLIVAQRNAYCMSHLTSPREFMRLCVYFILRERYELFPSFKSILCDSKLGFAFNRFRDRKFFNSKFMLKGHDFWRYKLKKNLYTLCRLKRLLKKVGFSPINVSGAYYCVSESLKYYNLNLKTDDFFKNLADKRAMSFLTLLAEAVVILSEKDNQGI